MGVEVKPVVEVTVYGGVESEIIDNGTRKEGSKKREERKERTG